MASDHQHDAARAIETLTGFINTDTLLDLAHRFSATYADLARTSTEHFLVTPVTALPTGKEKGKFLSIDVGGSNLRVGFVELVGEPDANAESERERDRSTTIGENVFAQIKRSHDKSWPIGDHLKMDQAEDLFAWIGDCIAEVVRDALEEQNVLPDVTSPIGDEILLGITFSFPMAQTRLSEATLLPMGKGFAITSDLNLGKMLLAGYARHCDSLQTSTSQSQETVSSFPRIRIAAITNDTVATFASLAYAVKATPNSRVAMGLIVGTGTNATVPMKPANLHPSKRAVLSNPEAVETVVINTEWTIRGTDKPLVDLSIKTPWDITLDANSDAPGFQPFEYMTSGRYLGEIVRLAFVDIVSKEADGVVPPSLQINNALPTWFLSEVIARKGGRGVQQELEARFPEPSSSEDPFWTVDRVEMIRDIAEAVQERSSALVAVACVGLLNCVGDIALDDEVDKRRSSNGTHARGKREIDELVIAYAGGTISQYPKWLQSCQKWIDILVEEGSASNRSKQVTLKEAKDGGIIGAGVLAGMAGEMA